MQTLKVFGQVDASHRLSAAVPSSIRPGRVEVVVIVPTESTDDADADWSHGIAQEWKDELSDPREDIWVPASKEGALFGNSFVTEPFKGSVFLRDAASLKPPVRTR